MNLEIYPMVIKNFFMPQDIFRQDEWLLKHQISAMMILHFFLGLGVLPFAYVRLSEGNVLVGISQILFGSFLLYSFYAIRKNKHYYTLYSILFFLFLFTYTTIIFFFVPQNTLNILWVIATPILIFFFLNKKAGIFMFFLVLLFIFSLIIFDYHYNIAEYITLLGAFFTTSFIMFTYEKVKESENIRLSEYAKKLQKEVKIQTQALQSLNENLQKSVNDELAKRLTQEQMLLRQSRMASIGEMIDCIAHQWRQPLMNINAVMMNVDRGIEIHQEEHLLREKVLEVFSLTAHMSHTIEDFRNLLKVEKEKQYFRVEEIISNVLTLMKNNLKGIDVICSIEDAVSVKSYKSELSQVLITLLSNAFEVLHLNCIEDKKIFISVKEVANSVLLTVEDNAGGINKENISKIFDPYFTTKTQMGGTGLGLYIAEIIIEQNMQGMLEVSNTKSGALFSISMPLE